MPNCPICNYEGAYIGFKEIECINIKCEHYNMDWHLANVHPDPEVPLIDPTQNTNYQNYNYGGPCGMFTP